MSECTTVLMDNSEWTRSGDYAPTRFQAQADAVNLLAGAKTQAHPENTVGVLTMAGKTPQVLVTPTPDLGKVLNCMTEIDIDGESHFTAAVQVAQLALKHRQNKNQRQRIVIFVASPIQEDKVCGVPGVPGVRGSGAAGAAATELLSVIVACQSCLRDGSAVGGRHDEKANPSLLAVVVVGWPGTWHAATSAWTCVQPGA